MYTLIEISVDCALGTDCSGSPSSTPTSGTSSSSASPSPPTSPTTTTTPTSPATPSPLPSGWILASACAQDSSSRVLVNDVTTILSDNTPSACAAHCYAANYYYAGVEYGDECHCGTGIVSGADTPLDPSQCSMACAGDVLETCGGSWAIQLYQYQGQAPTETLPKGWVPVTPCAVDTAERDINGDLVTTLSNNTPVTCIEYCAAAGFDYAGVEYGDECHCGTGTTIRQIAPASDCSMPCAGDAALTCGGPWRIQIYSSRSLRIPCRDEWWQDNVVVLVLCLFARE